MDYGLHTCNFETECTGHFIPTITGLHDLQKDDAILSVVGVVSQYAWQYQCVLLNICSINVRLVIRQIIMIRTHPGHWIVWLHDCFSNMCFTSDCDSPSICNVPSYMWSFISEIWKTITGLHELQKDDAILSVVGVVSQYARQYQCVLLSICSIVVGLVIRQLIVMV